MTAVTSENRRSQTAATEMIIRDAGDADLPAIIDIYNAAIATRMATAQLDPVTLEERRDWLKEHSPDRHPFWVLETDGRIAGWLSLKPFALRCAYRGTAEISVYVDEKFRRRGVARRLLEEAIVRSPSLEITAIVGLILIYHFAKICLGEIVEVGAFVGGATIAAAFGVRDSRKRKALIAIEQGGSLKHKRLGTRNILRDLERNLARQRVSEMVTLINGHSFDPATIATVRQTVGSDEIGLLIVDADAAKQRAIDCYRDKLADGCWMVIDDYYGPATDVKITSARADVDALVAAGCLEPQGFYGWSTWVVRWSGCGIEVIR